MKDHFIVNKNAKQFNAFTGCQVLTMNVYNNRLIAMTSFHNDRLKF